jgi:tetratricopeptide (TPR) repeat protein
VFCVLQSRFLVSPRDAAAHYALGLTLTRLKQPGPALAEFRRAAELAPEDARYQYVYGVAPHSASQGDEAMTVLKEALKRHPGNRDILLALLSFSRNAGDVVAALAYAEQLAVIAPDDQSLAGVVQELRRQITKPSAQ